MLLSYSSALDFDDKEEGEVRPFATARYVRITVRAWSGRTALLVQQDKRSALQAGKNSCGHGFLTFSKVFIGSCKLSCTVSRVLFRCPKFAGATFSTTFSTTFNCCHQASHKDDTMPLVVLGGARDMMRKFGRFDGRDQESLSQSVERIATA